MKVIRWLAASVLPIAMSAHAQPPYPDFTGHWKLSAQESSAWRGRSAIGRHEEPVIISRNGTRLMVEVQVSAPGAAFAYDLSGMPVTVTEPGGEILRWSSRWEGETLVSKGRRLFSTSDGPRAFAFEEHRSLSADGTRMTVRTRINMFPRDLVRTSVYEKGQ